MYSFTFVFLEFLERTQDVSVYHRSDTTHVLAFVSQDF